MAPKKTLPKDAYPGTGLFVSPRTGEYFESVDALFEHLVTSKIPPPSRHKGKDKVFTTKPVVWHEKSLKQIDLGEYSTRLDFHVELTMLFMVPLTPLRSLHTLVGTLFGYLQSRFVKNEQILLAVDQKWIRGTISAVSVDEAVVLSSESVDGTRFSPCHFVYDVTLMEQSDESWPVGAVLPNIRCNQLRREQGTFTRAQLRASILQHCKCRDPRKSDSIWTLKKKTILDYNLNRLSWLDLFAGTEPRFTVPSKASKNFPRKDASDVDSMGKLRPDKVPSKKGLSGHVRKDHHSDSRPSGSKRKLDDGHPSKYESIKKKHKSHASSDGKSKEKAVLSSAERAERKKAKQQEYKKRWREKLKQEREKYSNVWAQVFSVREDLECHDLKPLSVVPRVLDTMMPDKFIGDALFVLEFIRVFGPGLDKACDFADIAGWDLDRLYSCLSTNEIDGDFTRLLGFACKAIVSSIPRSHADHEAAHRTYSNGWQLQGANVAVTTLQSTGVALHNLPITGPAISEVVRLCILAACVPHRPLGTTESRYHPADNATLRLLKSQTGSALYRRLLSETVFALSFGERLDLVVKIFQAVMEEEAVRNMLDQSNLQAEEDEKALKGLKSLGDEISKLKGKPVPAKSEREPDKPGEKNDRFRQLLDAYARKRSGLRSEKDKTAREIAEDIRLLDEGRKHRRLSEVDVPSLIEALEDQNNKFIAQLKEERNVLLAQLQTDYQNFRLEPIGMDRHSFRYWDIPCVAGLVIERTPGLPDSVCVAGCLCQTVKPVPGAEAESSSWWQVSSEDDMLLLTKNLLLHGERELALKRGMDNHMQAIKDRTLTAPARTTPTVASSDRVVPEISSSDVFDGKLRAKLDHDLESINAKLIATKLGGIPLQDQEAWKLGLSAAVPLHKSSVAEYTLTNAPSPEISAPASAEEKIPSKMSSSTEEPMEVEEAAMEPIRLTVNRHQLTGAASKSEELDEPPNSVSPTSPEEADDDDSSDDESDRRDETSTMASTKKSSLVTTGQPPVAPQQSDDVRGYINMITRLVDTVKPRFLGAPLVSINENYVKNVSQLNFWKISLSACHSLSRLYIHLQVLKKCILWDKSTNNALCKGCRKRGDSTNIAACDRCDKTFHLNCLLPPLKAVPEESWVCPICEPSTVPRTTRRARPGGFSYAEDSLSAPSHRPTENGVHSATTKHSSRTARALQRNQTDFYEEYVPDEEEENSGSKQAGNDTRRSGRRKRVDYKGLAEGTSQESESDVNGMEDDDVYESEMLEDEYDTVSSVESDHSEYDPNDGEKPKWGNKHKKTKRSS